MAAIRERETRQLSKRSQCSLSRHQHALGNDWHVSNLAIDTFAHRLLTPYYHSSLTRLTEEDLHAELEKAEGLRLQDSASQASANIDIKRSVEEGNALIKTVASEIRSFISGPDMYAGFLSSDFQALTNELGTISGK